MEETYELTMGQIQDIVKNAMVYQAASGFSFDEVVEAVPGLVGFVVYQTGLK